MHWTACAAMRRPGGYWHLLPSQVQARRSVWSAVNPHTGRRRIHEAFPPEIIARTLENEMMIEFQNGSTWQLLGSDNYDSLVGSPPVGLVFSEFALADPAAWSYLRPILRENDGSALFITTPRGRNHAHTFYTEALADPDWFAELLPATSTNVFSAEDLETEQRELIREYGEDQGTAIFNQEYLCSFESPLSGSYYGAEMERASREGRISNVPHVSHMPVHTAWDLGISDATAIIMFQLVGKEIHVIDAIENSGVGMDWYVRELQTRRYVWGTHILPPDVQVRELGSGRSRLETLRSLGISGRVVAQQSIQDGINAVRTLLPQMWFDREKAKRLIASLQQYHRTWDDKRKCYNDRPYHDWTSHYCDSVRYMAMANVRNAGKREIKYSDKGIV